MPRTILLCDDSMMARVMLKKAAEKVCDPEDEILVAEHAEHAMELIGDKELTLAIVDFNMPGIDGLKLAKKLRHRQLGLPIALCSANIQNAIKDKAAALEVQFISKPITDDNISSFIRENG